MTEQKLQPDEPCRITPDGWCATHSTEAGPVYCTEDRIQ